MDEPLRSGNRPKPQHWKSDESTEVEGTSAEEDQDWNWTNNSEGRSSLSAGSVCALVASDGQVSLRRSISETDLLVSKEDLVGITGLCGPVVDELLLANVRDHGWDTEHYLSEVLVAGFEESERKTSEAYRKVFGYALHCLALHRVVSETCVLFAVNAFWATLSGRVATVSIVLVSHRCSECRSCVVAPNAIDFCVYCGELPHEPVPCAQMMELCKALEELHVELEELPLEQYRARDELPLMQQWARSADVETMDLLTTATSQPTLSAAEPRRLRNDFEDFFDTRRPQLIRSAEIALPLLTSWDSLVVDKPADARSRSEKSTEQVLAETTRPCPRCFIPIRQTGGCVHMTCGNWTSATHDASFCTGRAEASHLEVLASVQAHDTRPAEDTCAEEVFQRFCVALTTRLESDAELLSAEDADVLLRWRRLLEFYDHRETQIRATAQVVFANVVDSHRAQQELIELQQVVAPTVS